MARIVVQPCVQLALNELRVITTNIPTIAASLENVNKPWCPSNKCNCMQLRNQLQNIGTTLLIRLHPLHTYTRHPQGSWLTDVIPSVPLGSPRLTWKLFE